MSKNLVRFLTWLGMLVIFAGIPLFVWSLMLPFGGRWSPESNAWRSLGQISGLLGMSFFAGSLLLSVRTKFLDKLFGGLNFVYRDHHWLGTLGFCLLLVHPLALAYRFALQSLAVAGNFLIPNPNDWSIFLGIVSLMLLMVLLVMTYFWRPTYHIWFLSHKFMALAYAIGWWHLLTIDSDVSRSLSLRWYYYLLGLASIAVIIYRVVGHRKLVPRATYSVDKISELTSGLWEIYLKAVTNPISCHDGQFAFFTFINNHLRRDAHPFSIAGSNAQGGLRLIIKALGDQTGNLGQLVNGDQVLVEGPYGSFGRQKDKKEIWIAGGIGITPFLSLACSRTNEESVVLIHTVAESAQNIFAKEFPNTISSSIKFIPWVSSTDGRLNAEAIEKVVSDWRERTILMCGPIPMMNSLRSQFMKLGGDKNKIISEDFNL